MKNHLQSIKLSHYQSHRDSELTLDPGINVIIGDSKSGKTSILRAIRTIKENKPTGLAYNSYWNRDKRGEPVEEHSATLTFSDSTTIKRVKTKDSNSYVLNGVELEAVGRGAPPKEVEKALNISETNFQKQFDQPFLLSESSAEIGRFLNKIVDLDLSDKILAKAETDRRKISSDIKVLDEEIKVNEEELKGFDWIEDAENLVKDIERKQNRIDSKKEARDFIFLSQQTIKSYQKTLNEIEQIPFEEIYTLMDNIKNLNDEITGLNYESSTITDKYEILKNYKKSLKEINKIPFEEIYTLMDQKENIEDSNEKLKGQIDDIEFLLVDMNKYKKTKIELENEIKILEKEFPDLCPLCKKPLKEDTCI